MVGTKACGPTLSPPDSLSIRIEGWTHSRQKSFRKDDRYGTAFLAAVSMGARPHTPKVLFKVPLLRRHLRF